MVKYDVYRQQELLRRTILKRLFAPGGASVKRRCFFQRGRNLEPERIFDELSAADIAGYQLTIVYEMSSVGETGVKTVTMQFDTEETAQAESQRHEIGTWEEVEGIRVRVHDTMLTTTYVKNMPNSL